MTLNTNDVRFFLTNNPGQTTEQIRRHFQARTMQVRGCLAQLTKQSETQHTDGRWSIKTSNGHNGTHETAANRPARSPKPEGLELQLRRMIREELRALVQSV